MHKGIIIYLAIILGLILTAGGSYLVIDNFIKPSGLLFEGVVSISLGIIMLLIIIVANTIGKTIMLFGEILEQTTKLNQEIVKNRPPAIPSIFSGLMNPGASVTVTDTETGESNSASITGNSGDSIKKINDMIISAMSGGIPSKNKSLNDLSIKELEKKLATAIKVAQF